MPPPQTIPIRESSTGTPFQPAGYDVRKQPQQWPPNPASNAAAPQHTPKTAASTAPPATSNASCPPKKTTNSADKAKSTRLKKDKTKVKASKVFKGKKAYRLFLQAWGFLLWKMCYVLVKERGVSGELWGVVRDLWGVRVRALSGRFEEGGDGVESTDIEGEGAEQLEQEQRQSKTARKASDSPSLIDVAALNYLGILILRYPLGLNTFFE